jgi:diadenosine tetraphosphatase ApaH/serine/threonine PP2A family protein phosphatase
VGYGPKPNECVKLAKEKLSKVVAGNHDLGSVGSLDIRGFTDEAQFVSNWTKEQLELENFSYLKELPLTEKPLDEVTLVHGSLRSPLLEYILTDKAAKASLQLSDSPICFFGHTHLPIIYKLKEGKLSVESLTDKQKIILDKEAKYLINPGSVGQPRDGDPRASYLIFDTKQYCITLMRVNYKIEKTQKLMQEAGLPQTLIERLSAGL